MKSPEILCVMEKHFSIKIILPKILKKLLSNSLLSKLEYSTIFNPYNFSKNYVCLIQENSKDKEEKDKISLNNVYYSLKLVT